MNPSRTEMKPREITIGTIQQEHRALGTVIEVLQRLLRDIAAKHSAPDFRLLSTALYYIDAFPERYHHPKEDQYLFKALRDRTAEFNPLLDELEAEHVTSAHMVNHLHRALVHYEADAPQALSALRAGVDAYAAMLSEHMRKEEHLLGQAETVLTADDWSAMATAFLQSDDDPLFGVKPRETFRRLRFRIQTLLPTKMRPARKDEHGGRHPGSAGNEQ